MSRSHDEARVQLFLGRAAIGGLLLGPVVTLTGVLWDVGMGAEARAWFGIVLSGILVAGLIALWARTRPSGRSPVAFVLRAIVASGVAYLAWQPIAWAAGRYAHAIG